MKRKRRIILPAVLVLVLLAGAFFLYTADYYRAEAPAIEALASGGSVTVTETDYGWFFDGPADADALIFYPGGKVEETAYAPLLHRLAGWTNVLYFAQRPIEPVDFEPLNFYCAMQPNSGFRLNRTVNLTLPDGSKSLSGKHFTLRKGGQVTERDVTTHEELEALLREEFGIVIHLPRSKRL